MDIFEGVTVLQYRYYKIISSIYISTCNWLCSGKNLPSFFKTFICYLLISSIVSFFFFFYIRNIFCENGRLVKIKANTNVERYGGKYGRNTIGVVVVDSAEPPGGCQVFGSDCQVDRVAQVKLNSYAKAALHEHKVAKPVNAHPFWEVGDKIVHSLKGKEIFCPVKVNNWECITFYTKSILYFTLCSCICDSFSS